MEDKSIYTINDCNTAVCNEDKEAIKRIIDANQEGLNAYKFLNIVTAYDNLDLAKWLITEYRQELLKYPEKKATPIHTAITYNSIKVLMYLLNEGFPVNATDKKDETPYDYLIEEMAKLRAMESILLQHGGLPAKRSRTYALLRGLGEA